MKVKFEIWRQKNPNKKGKFKSYEVDGLTEDMSFLEAMDHLNEQLVLKDEEVIAFEYDCREGICGQCGVFINGRAHGPHANMTTCQLHMRSFSDGQIITVEPWRAKSFPIIKDLVVDRTALDRIIEAGAYISSKTGTAPEANAIPIPKKVVDQAMDSAACIGCGACVATCKNSSAVLFTSAKVNHLNTLPQGKAEASERLNNMTYQMDLEGFGNCSNTGACEIECPEGISIINIARLNSSWFKNKLL